jgi:GT2 family glycosyltransferase
MKLSVVILTWNSAQHIANCLTSILASLHDEFMSFEIFVIDNGSSDTTRQIIDEFVNSNPDEINPIYLDCNKGTTYSRNIALKMSSGDFIAIIDSDVIVRQGIFVELIDKLVNGYNIGMVVPRLTYLNGNFQKSTDNFPTVFTKLRRYFFLKQIEKDEETFLHLRSYSVDYAISAFWLLKREVVDSVGLLDERIFYAPEDVDYCLRIWKMGFRIVYVPSCEVVHNAQEISRGFKFNKAFWEHIKGLCYYFIKHKYFFTKPKVRKRSPAPGAFPFCRKQE